MNFQDLKKIAVLGAGTMSPGIAQSYASGGFEVCIWNHREPTLEKAKTMLASNIATFVEEGLYTESYASELKNRISFTTDLNEALSGAGFIQETVSEKPDIKMDLFEKVLTIADGNAIVVSNASSLNPFDAAPEKLLPRYAAAHWFAPPHIIPLVEVVKCEKTKQEVFHSIIELLEKCGKTPVRLEKYVPGYLINRIQILLNTEIFYLLEEGICSPEELDKAVKASLIPRGMVLGLVQRYDFTGLDISANNIKNASYVMPETSTHPKALFEHVEKGELGIKSGKGFYDYAGRSAVELSKKRDKMLLKVFEMNKDILKERI